MIDRLRYGLPTSSDRLLNHLIAWLATLLVVSIVGFGGYYYWDRMPGNTGQTPVERAMANAEGAVRTDPSDLGARLALADLYYNANRFVESSEQYQAALMIDDKNLVGMWGLGRALFAAGDTNGAEPNFQKIVDISQDNDIRGDLVGAAYYYLGKIALTRNDADKAIEQLKNAISIDRSDADAMQVLGAAYVAKGRYDEALDQLIKAARFVPDFTEAYTQMALAYDGKGMKDYARYARGMELFGQGQLSKSAKELQAATAALPDFADAWTGLGLVLEKQGKREAAGQAYQKAAALDPNSFNARTGLVRLGLLQTNDSTAAHGSSQAPDGIPAHSPAQGGGQ